MRLGGRVRARARVRVRANREAELKRGLGGCEVRGGDLLHAGPVLTAVQERGSAVRAQVRV